MLIVDISPPSLSYVAGSSIHSLLYLSRCIVQPYRDASLLSLYLPPPLPDLEVVDDFELLFTGVGSVIPSIFFI